jgi:hypothetical protein
MNSARPSFEELAEFVCDWAGISQRKVIEPNTAFEDDLGITGDDGCELLAATELRFGVCLSTPEHGYKLTFGLAPNEFLFHSEGFGPREILGIFGTNCPEVVRRFTVGGLFEAVTKAQGS